VGQTPQENAQFAKLIVAIEWQFAGLTLDFSFNGLWLDALFVLA